MTCPVSSATDRKVSGRQQPALGVLPADQRLDALHLAGVQPHDRLVVHDELVDRVAAQPGGDLEPPARGLAQRRREQVHAVAARALRREHRGVGVAEQLVRVARSRRGRRRRRCSPISGTEMPDGGERQAERRLQPEGQRRGLGGVAVASEDEELVAAQPADGVPGPHLVDQPAADLAQQRVADLVAEGVVDGLEPVEVDDQQRRPGPAGRVSPGPRR